MASVKPRAPRRVPERMILEDGDGLVAELRMEAGGLEYDGAAWPSLEVSCSEGSARSR